MSKATTPFKPVTIVLTTQEEVSLVYQMLNQPLHDGVCRKLVRQGQSPSDVHRLQWDMWRTLRDVTGSNGGVKR